MNGGSLTKFISSQNTLAFLDSDSILAGKDPFVAFLEADTAVAFCYFFQFGDVDTEFEGTTMAVTMVGLVLLGRCRYGVGHDWRSKRWERVEAMNERRLIRVKMDSRKYNGTL